MNILKVKDGDGNWVGIPALKGAPTDEQVQDAVDDYLDTQAATAGFFTNAAKHSLLDLLEKVSYTTSDARQYLTALSNELFNIPVSSISASFSQGQNVVYNTDSLDSLRQYLTVTATYIDSTSETVSAYTLTGTLSPGTSTITVNYGGKTDTISVTVIKGFLYVTADGKFSAQPYVTRLDNTTNSMTESITPNGTEMYSPKVTTVTGQFAYRLNDFDFTSSADVTVEFMIVDIGYFSTSNTTSPGQLYFHLTDGTNSCFAGFCRYGANNADVKIRTATGSSVAYQDVVSLNTWHTLRMIVSSGKQTISLDGTNVISDADLATLSDYGNTSKVRCAEAASNPTEVYIRKFECTVS